MVGAGLPERELYALLHLSPEASDEDIRKAYRQWAQVYHPDKYQSSHMKDIATENFQRIREAYDILSDERKRQIYDIYGMEGINSGLELGTKLSKVEEMKEEIERLRRRKAEEELTSRVRPAGSVLANLSVPQFLEGGGIMKGMAMSSELLSQISKSNTLVLGGNLAVNGNAGGGSATVVLRHQTSSVSSLELMASTGLRAIIAAQASRQLSLHSNATTGVAMSLRDGSITLSNTWTRQLSETSNGNIQLVLGAESSIAVGWRRENEKSSASGELKFGTNTFGASGHYTHHFSSKSHGRLAGRVGSTALEIEMGGGRKISEFNTVRLLYGIGIQGIFWRIEVHRGDQKLIIPILISKHLGSKIAAGAFLAPLSLYLFIEKLIINPYLLKRDKWKALEAKKSSLDKVEQAKAAAKKAQQLLENVSNRKKCKQIEREGLVVTDALYGSKVVLETNAGEQDECSSEVIDVTIPLNFLVNDAGQLKLHGGIKKAGIMGFCDPCPGEPKMLVVVYTYKGQIYKVHVDDVDELLIPQESDRL